MSKTVTDDKEVIRSRDGKFVKGVSGNPLGRPVGSKNRIAHLKQQMEEAVREHLNPKEIKAIVNAMVREAKGGNVQAAKLILDKVMSNASGSEDVGDADNRVVIVIENYTPQHEKVIDGVVVQTKE